MSRTLVSVDDLLAHERIDHGNGILVAGHGRFFISAGDGRRDAAHRCAHARAQGDIAGAMLFGLASSFFGGLGIGHETTVSESIPFRGPVVCLSAQPLSTPSAVVAAGRGVDINFDGRRRTKPV